jgi:hypothetical protein
MSLGFTLLGLNVIITLFGGIAIFYYGLSPIMHAYTLGVGGIWGILKMKNPKAGMEQSLHTLYKAVLWMFVAFMLSGLILSTVMFTHNPFLFWIQLLVVATLFAISEIFGIENKKTTARVMIGTALLCFIIWEINVPVAFPADQSKNIGHAFKGATSAISKVKLPSFSSCENLGGIVREEGVSFTFKKGCVTYLDAVLMRHGVDEAFFNLENSDKSLRDRQPGEFVQESEWVLKDNRWMIRLVPNDDAFGDRETIQMVAYSVKIRAKEASANPALAQAMASTQ